MGREAESSARAMSGSVVRSSRVTTAGRTGAAKAGFVEMG